MSRGRVTHYTCLIIGCQQSNNGWSDRDTIAPAPPAPQPRRRWQQPPATNEDRIQYKYKNILLESPFLFNITLSKFASKQAVSSYYLLAMDAEWRHLANPTQTHNEHNINLPSIM